MNREYDILLVDRSEQQAKTLSESLKQFASTLEIVNDTDTAIDILEESNIDILLYDLHAEGTVKGLDLLQMVKQDYPEVTVIIYTANPTIDSCKKAIKSGADDYVILPVSSEELAEIIKTLVPSHSLQSDSFIYEGIKSRSPSMKHVFNVLKKVSPTDISVLIEGESGTGKEITARAIHLNSRRKDMPFRPINCAGLSETLLESELFGHVKGAFTGAASDRKGLFEVADNGTLFLDEIGDMPLSMQAKLLRVLEDGLVLPVGSTKPVVVDVRVISATNHDLAKLVEEKKFRQDLYFRIKGVSVTLPPLRQRPEDIPELFGYFLKNTCRELGRDIHQITESAMTILVSYPWPGNIRQLSHAVRNMVVMCDSDVIDVNDIPLDIHHVKRLSGSVGTQKVLSQDMSGKSLEEVERMHIANTLEYTNNNRAEAAKILKIGERTLYRKIKEYNL